MGNHEVKTGSLAPGKKPSTVTREELSSKCEEVRKAPDILSKLDKELRACGFVGDTGPVALVYLATFTRFFDRPVSIALKGQSAAGKSTILKSALRYVSPDAYFEVSGMSDKALIHMEEDLRHRHLVIGEFAGLQNKDGNKWLRMLLSEGELAYTVAVPDPETGGHKAVTKRREGPTGCFLTTTEGILHPEDETRLLSVPVVGGVEQTRAVLGAQAARFVGAVTVRSDRESWLVFSDWVAKGPLDVVLPFAEELARRVDPQAERMKRDFPQILALVAAHALIHQESRDRNESGAVVGTLDDYRAVHTLVKSIIEQANDATVRPELAAFVRAVTSITTHRVEYAEGVPQFVVGAKVSLKPYQSSRLKDEAVGQGYLQDLNPGKGSPSCLVPGRELPNGGPVIPDPEDFGGHWVTEEVKV